jgi:hypothetical protein
MNTIRIGFVYGPLKLEQDYPVLAVGFDWYLVRCNGKPIYVPKYLTF